MSGYKAGSHLIDVMVLVAIIITAPIWIPAKGILIGANFLADVITGFADDVDHRRDSRRWNKARQRA